MGVVFGAQGVVLGVLLETLGTFWVILGARRFSQSFVPFGGFLQLQGRRHDWD